MVYKPWCCLGPAALGRFGTILVDWAEASELGVLGALGVEGAELGRRGT